MDADWGNNDFNLGGIEISLIEDVGDEFFNRLKGTVTFPVTADDHFSLRSFHFAVCLRDVNIYKLDNYKT